MGCSSSTVSEDADYIIKQYNKLINSLRKEIQDLKNTEEEYVNEFTQMQCKLMDLEAKKSKLGFEDLDKLKKLDLEINNQKNKVSEKEIEVNTKKCEISKKIEDKQKEIKRFEDNKEAALKADRERIVNDLHNKGLDSGLISGHQHRVGEDKHIEKNVIGNSQ